MKTFTWKTELPILAFVAAMFALTAIVWGDAPERMPVHWNAAGEVDRYGGKAEALLLLPLVALGIYGVTFVVSLVDPGRANFPAFRGAFAWIRGATAAFFLALHGVIVLTARGVHVPMNLVMGVLLSLLFIVLGAVMGKIRPNHSVGIRTPWTLTSKRAWTKTHRVGGFAMLGLGLLLLPVAVAVPGAFFVVLIAGSLALTALVMVISYAEWKRDPERVPPAGTGPG